jgi:hypothetical protein
MRTPARIKNKRKKRDFSTTAKTETDRNEKLDDSILQSLNNLQNSNVKFNNSSSKTAKVNTRVVFDDEEVPNKNKR